MTKSEKIEWQECLIHDLCVLLLSKGLAVEGKLDVTPEMAESWKSWSVSVQYSSDGFLHITALKDTKGMN